MNNLFATTLVVILIAPTVYGCVNFEAHHIKSDKIPDILDVSIWDEHVKVCHLHGLPDVDDGLYHLDCFPNDGVGIFDRNSGNVEYIDGAGIFNFPTNYHSDSVEWTACEYGCCSSDLNCPEPQWCFVQA